MNDGRPILPSEVDAQPQNIVVLTETPANLAKPWTAPAEISTSSSNSLADAFRDREGRVFVGVASGHCRALPADLDAKGWRAAINRSNKTTKSVDWLP